jgi:superfamily II helicase
VDYNATIERLTKSTKKQLERIKMCDYYDDSLRPTLIDIKTVKARKKHICQECGETINEKENYQRVKGLWEGEWDNFTICKICSDIRDDLCPYAPFTELKESIKEYYGVDLV